MDKQIITFSANEQILRKTGGLDIYASKTVSYIEAHFDLGQNWSGYDSIEAVWWNDYVRPVRTVLDTEGVCVVPTEVLLRKSVVYVNLVGVIASGNTLTDRLTTVPITALTVKFNAHTDGTETVPLTPSQFEQFVSIVQDAVANIKDIVSTTLNADYTLTFVYSDGTSYTTPSIRGERGPQGADGADGTDGNGIASAVLNSNYTLTLTFTDGTSYTTPSIRGAQGPKGDTGDVSQAQLDAAVSDLKSEMNPVQNSLFDGSLLSSYTSADGWKLVESGLCTSDSTYKMNKYKVNPGEMVRVISDHKFQFQNTESVPSYGDPNRVGKTYGSGEYILTVPSNAHYIIASTSKLSSTQKVYIATGIKSIKDAVRTGVSVYSNIVQGTIGEAGGLESTTRIRTEPIRISVGDEIAINPGSLQYVVGMWQDFIQSSNNIRNDQAWRGGAETITSTIDGYLIVAFRKSDNSTIIPSEYDGTVCDVGNQIKKNKDEIYEIKTSAEGHLALESGTFSESDGSKVQNAYRIRNKSLVPLSNIDSIFFPDGYSAWLFLFDESKQFIGTFSETLWKSGGIGKSDLADNVQYINLAFKKDSASSTDISSEISMLQSSIKVVTRTSKAINDIEHIAVAITSVDLERGSWDNNRKVSENTRIRTVNRIPVKKGDTIQFSSDEFYLWLSLFADATSTTALEASTAWASETVYVFRNDGVLDLTIANSSSHGTSTAIVPSDFTDTIFINKMGSTDVKLIEYIVEPLPDYYVAEVDDTRNKLSVLPSDNFNYLIITDIHYSHSDFTPLKMKQMMGAFRRIANGANIDAVMCLGDLIEGGKSVSKDTAKYQINRVIDEFADIRKPVLFARGNHDDNAYDWWRWEDSEKTIAKYLTLDEFNGMCERTFGNPSDVYAMDFPEKDTRIIIANTADYSEEIDTEGNVNITKPSDIRITGAQLDDIADLLYASPYDVIIGTHGLSEGLFLLIKAFNEHGIYSKNSGTDISFAGKTQTVKMMHVGHYHNDAMEYNETYKVNVIATSCGSLAAVQQSSTGDGNALLTSWEGSSAYRIIDKYPRTKGTANEACFDVVSIGHGKVTKIRFGAGSDGELDY